MDATGVVLNALVKLLARIIMMETSADPWQFRTMKFASETVKMKGVRLLVGKESSFEQN